MYDSFCLQNLLILEQTKIIKKILKTDNSWPRSLQVLLIIDKRYKYILPSVFLLSFKKYI